MLDRTRTAFPNSTQFLLTACSLRLLLSLWINMMLEWGILTWTSSLYVGKLLGMLLNEMIFEYIVWFALRFLLIKMVCGYCQTY